MTEKTQFLGFMFPQVVQRHYCSCKHVSGNSAYTLYQLLPPLSTSHLSYDLRPRRHHRTLPPTCLTDANFMHRLLYLNLYWF